jgi:hypothetical protein
MGLEACTTTVTSDLPELFDAARASWAIQFAVTKFLATGSQVPLFAAITLRVQKPLSNSSEGLFWVKFV